ncbi:aminotransferase class IV [Robiginitalea sp. M366]|uniref:aminotransferase class IV n=1 Tax=Robiginitalea aestuariiviva TaxID=3036903 RepID=UPI00240D920B|nr:aminotransferase class IV [Robiginitalea aestuariiviva]MDG1572268.1 aminotransferase class IV [Robiginitalea aestuariiviva]
MAATYPKVVFLNGEILEAEKARISVFDRGFIFGDGIYEVMARIGGKFFYGPAHWDRLRTCLKKIGIRLDVEALEQQVPALLQASGLEDKDSMLYIQVTRGVAPRQHAFPGGLEPTVLMYAWAKTLPDIPGKPVEAVTMEDFRWTRCDIKMTSLLGNVMANQNAVENGCYETVLVREGVVTEASHCNVFFVKDGVVYTHPADRYILDGITRQVVLECCEKLQIPVRLEGIAAADIPHMDEAFLTGTSTQVTAIGRLDKHVFNTAAAGPVTQRLQEAFLGLKQG